MGAPGRLARIVAVIAVAAAALAVVAPSAPASATTVVAAAHVRIETTAGLLGTVVRVTALDAADAPVAAVPVTLTRTTAVGTLPVGVLVTGADGSASTTDPFVPLPSATYRARLVNGSMAVRTAALAPLLSGAGPALPGLAPLGNRAIPLDGFVDLAVDDAHAELFVSTGGDIQVFDADGNRTGTVAGTAGAQALVLSQDGTTLFADGAGPTGLVVVDTLAKAVVGTMPFAVPAADPTRLSSMDRAADRLVLVAGGGDPYGAQLAVIPLADPGALVFGPSNGWGDDYWLAGDPIHPRVMTNGPYSAASGTLWDVSGTPRSVRFLWQFPESPDTSFNTRDLEFSQDGTDLFLAAGAPYHSMRIDPDTFTVDARYEIGAYPVAIAPTRNGLFVATTRDGYGVPAEVWDASGTVRVAALPDIEADGTTRSMWYDTGALAFSQDSSRLYAVRGAPGYIGIAPELHIWANPLVPCSIRLDGTLDALGNLDVTALVSGASGPLVSQGIDLTVQTPAGPIHLGADALLTGLGGLLHVGTHLATPLASAVVTATVQLPGAVAPCLLRTILERPPTVPGLPSLLGIVTGPGAFAAWWQPPADTGGPPVLAYSVVAVDVKGQLAAWVNVGADGFVAGARLPKGTYAIYIVGWNRLGLGIAAAGAAVIT